MPHGQTGRFEFNGEHAPKDLEHPFDHGLKREVLFYFLVVQRVFFFFELVIVIAPFPGVQGFGRAAGAPVLQLGPLAQLFAAFFLKPGPGALQELYYGGAVFCHTVVQHILREIGIADKFGYLTP